MLPVAAQDSGTAAAAQGSRPQAAAGDSGTEMVFGFSQGLEANDNLDLDPVSLGSTVFTSTELSFGLTKRTPLDRFGLLASGVLRGASGPGTQSGLDDQTLELSYGRLGADAEFKAEAGYRQTNIEFLEPLDNITDEDGQIDLPPDLDRLDGTGNRERYAAGVALELGREAPVGASFRADYLGLRYSDTSDADLFDSDRSEAETELRFRLSPVAVARLGLGYGLYEAEDEEQTRRDTSRGYAGLSVELSPVLRLDANAGYAAIDTREFGVTTRSSGLEALLRLERDMPNGTVTAEAEQYVTDDGTIRTLTAGRSLELPAGTLSATLGAADSDLGRSEIIGSLAWSQDLPRGGINAQLRRWVDFDEDDGNVLRTALLLDYVHEINGLSSIGLKAGYTVTDEAGGSTDRASFTAEYSYALTEDWSLKTGYRYRMREELAEARAQSHAVFVSIGRDFRVRR
ncbi:hypothetical protein [Leisingera sp. ANG-M7]|uniref:hypothetical protein n=1 Tax=Leisingera sp. ANG-M7 TaxID=1577902 RepID=UPI00057D8EB9|nr:hypothetical protein [Leisingera sp. ANG-M7]KIC35679.1 hypothetical protein RA26_16670 [Leisingera sp. ANG-M7]